MRQFRFDIKSIVITLIITNVVIFFITQINYFPIPDRFLNNLVSNGKTVTALAMKRHGLFTTLFSLFPVMIVSNVWIWQFLTYMFLHGGFMHLFFNMFALLLFGRPLEQRWGWKEFLFFYLLTGTGAGIVTFFWNIARNPYIPTIGASGAIFGIILAFGLEFPETVLLLFFILPIKAKYAALIFGGIELFMIITGKMQGVGHFTHLAGLFFGYIYYVIRIRGKSRGRPLKIQSMVKEAVHKKRSMISEKKLERITQTALNIKEKLGQGASLTNSEEVFLSKLRKAYERSGNKICTAEEFDLTAPDCMRCDAFYACLYRYIIMVL